MWNKRQEPKTTTSLHYETVKSRKSHPTSLPCSHITHPLSDNTFFFKLKAKAGNAQRSERTVIIWLARQTTCSATQRTLYDSSLPYPLSHTDKRIASVVLPQTARSIHRGREKKNKKKLTNTFFQETIKFKQQEKEENAVYGAVTAEETPPPPPPPPTPTPHAFWPPQLASNTNKQTKPVGEEKKERKGKRNQKPDKRGIVQRPPPPGLASWRKRIYRHRSVYLPRTLSSEPCGPRHPHCSTIPFWWLCYHWSPARWRGLTAPSGS